MTQIIFRSSAGNVALPDANLVLCSRLDGGNLIVSPATDVWDRGELTDDELIGWSRLVAATAKAMLAALPQLEGGCINYWDAGNWALNELAPPPGPKNGRQHRRLHLHLLGRSRTASDPAWKWGEAPKWPDYVDRHRWAAGKEQLTAGECQAIVAEIEALMTRKV